MLGIFRKTLKPTAKFSAFHFNSFSLMLLLLLSPFCQRAAEPPAHPERRDSLARSDGAAEAEAEAAAALHLSQTATPQRVLLISSSQGVGVHFPHPQLPGSASSRYQMLQPPLTPTPAILPWVAQPFGARHLMRQGPRLAMEPYQQLLCFLSISFQ